jgi:MYXO-CTERM domain-containing protein
MPNGFGFYWHGHSATAAYATLKHVKIAAGPDGLVNAAREAVVQLAATNGVKVAAANPPADHTNRDRLIIIIAAVALIALALLARLALRRRS